MMRLPFPLALVAFVATLAQASSTRLEPFEAPGFVFDSGRQRGVFFGGGFGQNLGSVTWEYDGQGWTRIQTSSPPRRNFHGMAYDRRRSRVVLFGGFGADRRPLGDTWEYDGSTWQQVHVQGPSARGGLVMAYDTKRSRTVLYGGSAGVRDSPFFETWEWDGATWTHVRTTAHPTGNALHRMVFDERRAVTVAFGGSPINGETWTFDGRDWRMVSNVGPGPRDHHAMTYSDRLGQVLLFGGWNGRDQNALRDLWAWDGRQWTEVDRNGPADYGVHPAFFADEPRQRQLLFGSNGLAGVAGFWQFDGRAWSVMK